jgi:hypothetical protein
MPKLGKRFDLFFCMVGDSDHSFGFSYYKNGELVRKFAVIDPIYQKPEIIEDSGKPIHLEEQSLKHSDEFLRVLSLAESIGVNLRSSADMKFYVLLD